MKIVYALKMRTSTYSIADCNFVMLQKGDIIGVKCTSTNIDHVADNKYAAWVTPEVAMFLKDENFAEILIQQK